MEEQKPNPEAASFNDDDVYVYDARTMTVIRSYGRSVTAQMLKDGRMKLAANQEWCTGLQAKMRGVLR